MGRELRKVPANWEHPKQDNGQYQPMFNTYYGDAINQWIIEHLQWEEGTHPDLIDNPDLKKDCPFFAMWTDNPPRVNYYQSRKYTPEELTHIQLYETTTEGTPISPVFRADKFEELCEYAAKNATTFSNFNAKATKEEWMEKLRHDYVRLTEGYMHGVKEKTPPYFYIGQGKNNVAPGFDS